MKKLAVALLASSAALSGTAHAAPIVIQSATASSSYPSYEAPFAIDGNTATDWASNGGGATNSFLNLNLGSGFVLNTVTVVDRTSSGGGNGSLSFGTTDYTTSFTLSLYADAGFTTPLQTFTFTKGQPTGSTAAGFTYTSAVPAGLKAQYVRYSVASTNVPGSNPGLAEIGLTGSVPEPATWAMMLLGFGMVGFGLRSRSAGKVNTRVAFG